MAAQTIPGIKMPPASVIKKLADIEVQQLDGGWIKVGSLWEGRPAAIVWLRHYGCIFCREQASKLHTIKAEAEKIGDLAIMSTGSVDQARDFDQTYGKGLRSLVDSERNTYKVLSFKRGGLSGLDPRVSVRGIQAGLRGFRQGRTRGDAMQLGGVLVMATGGEPVFFQRSEFAGDHARLEQILEALREAAALGSPPVTAAAGASR